MGNSQAKVGTMGGITEEDIVGSMVGSKHDRPASPTDLTASTRSTASVTSVSSTKSIPAPSLHDNLMRRQNNRNPMLYYETIQVLGFGSMGSVAKVKKRDSAIGGSSREEFVVSIHGFAWSCFSLPVIGGVMRMCTGKDLGRKTKKDIFKESPSAMVSSTHSRRSSVTSESRGEIFYALKTIHHDRVTDETFIEELRNEIDILKTLDHPNIVRPIETFNYHNQTSMVLEICSGGDLYCRDPYTEAEAARITSSILSAVEYMHSHNIIHRDLKYENIMFTDASPDAEVKIIDFGLSKKYASNDDCLHDAAGTFYTMAPEVLKGDYTSQADLWSIGVISFMLLSSQMPFYGKSRETVIRKILRCKFAMKGRRWKKVSARSKSFVVGLLQLDPSKRPTAVEAMKSEWTCQQLNKTNASDEEMDNVQASLENFCGYSKLKKLALMVVAHKSTSKEIGFLRKLFDKYDRHHNGMITFGDFKETLARYGYNDEELQRMFDGANLDGTGTIHYTEFLAATIDCAHGAITEEALADAFDRIDSDDSGYISTQNLRDLLGEQIPKSYIEEIISEADITKDHRISYAAFLALWDQEQEEKRKRLDSLQKVKKRRFVHSPPKATDDSSLGRIPEATSAETAPVQYAEEGREDDKSVHDSCGMSLFMSEKATSVRRYEQMAC